jgi:hypothetical protein
MFFFIVFVLAEHIPKLERCFFFLSKNLKNETKNRRFRSDYCSAPTSKPIKPGSFDRHTSNGLSTSNDSCVARVTPRRRRISRNRHRAAVAARRQMSTPMRLLLAAIPLHIAFVRLLLLFIV